MTERKAEIGRDHGLDTLIAPVRPTLKHRYPLTPIDRYLSWRRPDGTHLDPWLRAPERSGDIVKVATRSVVVTGTVAQWEGSDGDDASGERRVRRVGCAGAERDRP